MKNTLRVYKDKKLTQEIISVFSLGIVPAGESKEFTFWVVNDSIAYLKQLEFIVTHNEVEVIEAPTELMAEKTEKLILKWSPSITLKQGLKTRLSIRGIELWG